MLEFLEELFPKKKSVSRLHWYTTVGLFTFSVLNCLKTFFGGVVSCESHDANTPPGINILCLMQFSAGGHNEARYDEDAQRINRYVWTGYFFFFQAVVLYSPGLLTWPFKTRGKTNHALVKRLGKAALTTALEERNQIVTTAAEYFVSSRGTLGNFSLWRLFREAVRFLLLLVNFCWAPRYLGYSVSEFNARVWAYVWGASWEGSQAFQNPMYEVFPRSRECIIPARGPDGVTVNNHTTICLMTLNAINEQLFVILWIWYIVLLVINGLFLVHQILHRLDTKYLKHKLQSRLRRCEVDPSSDDFTVKLICKVCAYESLSALTQVGRPADPYVYGEFLRALGRQLETKFPQVAAQIRRDSNRGMAIDLDGNIGIQ